MAGAFSLKASPFAVPLESTWKRLPFTGRSASNPSPASFFFFTYLTDAASSEHLPLACLCPLRLAPAAIQSFPTAPSEKLASLFVGIWNSRAFPSPRSTGCRLRDCTSPPGLSSGAPLGGFLPRSSPLHIPVHLFLSRSPPFYERQIFEPYFVLHLRLLFPIMP